jgi:phosphate:Na+ symporter
MVKFLNRIFKEKRTGLAEPRYLNEASMEFPETVLQAVRKETEHLYENAFAIISQGISLKPDVIYSEDNLVELIHRPGKVVPFDIDAEYDLKVKALYNAIIEYISRSQQTMPLEFNQKLNNLRQAARDIVEAVKDTKHLQKNLSRYIASENEDIRREYNHLRVQIANVMRQLQNMRTEDDEDATVLSLDMLKVEMEKTDASVNGMMDKLIRENLITAPMATSLMNDSGYAYDISRNLIAMGTTLFGDHDLDVSSAESSLALDQDEIDEILANKDND